MNIRNYRMAGVALGALLVTACGRGPEMIDRTQPNYIRKAELTSGQWYIQDTVVDVPPTSALTFEGYQNDVDKVRFEVQEKFLVAYRTYEFIPGTDANVDRVNSRIGNVVTLDGKPYRGAPVAAWPIESHFDRQRQYNPATGEQNNVLEENSSDRPWYQREFIRVDWGNSAIMNFNSAAVEGGLFTSYVQPVDQETGDDRVVAAYADEENQTGLNYFDFTTRAFMNPETYDYPGYGEIPYCWLDPTVECMGTMIKIRTSLKKVDEARVQDYEPLSYGDKLMKKFGYFRAGLRMETPTYDRDRGLTLSGRLQYAQRHNIWEKARDADGNTLPVTVRTPRPIVYYVSDNYPADLWESAENMEASWDHAFRRAVAVPRGQDVSQVRQMFFVCQNPVPAGAPAECGPEGLHVRTGDLRYNIVNYVSDLQLVGPLGYGPSGIDPETGEVVKAAANVYAAGLDTASGSTMQTLEVLIGEISIDELITGKATRDFLAENRNATDPRRPASGPWSSQQGLINAPDVPGAAFAGVSGELKAKMAAYKQLGSLPKLRQDRRAVVDQLIAQNPSLEGAMLDAPEVRAAVLAAAPGEKYRQKLLTDPAFYRQVARQTMLRMDELDRLYQEKIDRASRNNLWLAEFSDDAYYALAEALKAKFESKLAEYQAAGKSAAEARTLAKTDAYNLVRIGLMRFLLEHEVGHTLGLMHNFAGSFDALNYKDGYWDLRKETVGIEASGSRVMPITPQDLLDASKMNQAQIDGNMRSFEYSTVMDYSSRYPLMTHGVGKYDEAAILFAYSGGAEPGWVEVFTSTRADSDPAAYSNPNSALATSNSAKPLLVRGAHTEIPLAHVEHWTPASTFYTDKFHYTTVPFAFAPKVGGGFTFQQALEEGLARMNDRTFVKWSDQEQLYARIERELKQYTLDSKDNWILRWYERAPADHQKARDVIGKIAQDQIIPVEVPYMFCSDYEVGAVLSCNRFDSGADYYEMTRDWLDRYSEYYVFSNFKRDRYFFDPYSVFRQKFGRYTANIPNVYQHWIFNIYWTQFYLGISTNEMENLFGAGDPLTQNYWTMAVVDGVNHLLQEFSTPSAGYFGKETGTGRWVHLEANNSQNTRLSASAETAFKASHTTGAGARFSDVVYVPRGPGRSMYTLFENDGYDFYRRVSEVGHFWDQYGALMALTSSETNFLGVDRGSDALRYSLPFYMTFPKELSKTVSDVWLEKNEGYASFLTKTGDGLATVKPPTAVRGEDYVSGFVYPTNASGTPVSGTELVEASPTWSTRFYSELFGMAYFTENFDQSFAMQNQVYRLGSGEQITPSSGFEVVTFDDPFGGGYSYAALQPIGETNPAAAPYQVRQAKVLHTQWQAAKAANNAALAAELEGKTREAVRNLEMMRGLYGIFSQVW